MALGDYPIDYNPKVHGPYDPSRYYGKPDTPFGQVKLGELLPWILRRNKSPSAVMGVISRGYWKWQHKYVHPKRSGIASYLQIATASMIFFYYLNYDAFKGERSMQYH